MAKTGTTWNFTYDADGFRTSRSNGTTAYNYVYSDGVLRQMTCGSNKLVFAYGVDGRPYAVQYNGTYYYYLLNLQGDVIGIANTSGTQVVSYAYDPWGNILSVTDSTTSGLGQLNPLRYRGYVYDNETGLYYVQTRYYNPEIGRWINADGYAATGQGFVGNNMFAYCGNNPVINCDPSGEFFFTILGAVIGAISGAIDSAIMGGSAEDIVNGAISGGVAGAIAGAGVDVGVAITAATAGAGMGIGLAVAGTMGAVGSAVGTGISTNWKADPLDYAASAIVGGALNMVSFGLAPINKEIVSSSLTTITKELMREGTKDLAMNTATGFSITVATTWVIRVITQDFSRTRTATVNERR